MIQARYGHSATALSDGRVLVAAGAGMDTEGGTFLLQSAEIYDPATGRFTATGASSYFYIYSDAATVLLTDGSVLFCGGTIPIGGGGTGSTLAERYDPATGSFQVELPMVHPRTETTATRLGDGRVLVVGGGAPFVDPPVEWTRKAEIYDPAMRGFAEAGEAGFYRSGHTATLLHDGRVLITGGHCATRFGDDGDYGNCSSAELYDPQSDTFAPTGSMAAPRVGHRATALADGRVLITGGYDNVYGEDLHPSSTAEIYDPVTGVFRKTASDPLSARAYHAATSLPNGEVLLAGGYTGLAEPPTVVMLEVYSPSDDRFRQVGELRPEVGGVLFPSATVLSDGRALLAGGYYFPGPHSFFPGAVNNASLFGAARPDAIFDDGFEG